MSNRLRIASVYENRLGRNDGNPLYMWWAISKYDPKRVESGHLVPYGDLTAYGKWDLWLECDWGEDALKGILPYEPVEIPRPNAFWHSDTHLGYDWRLAKARKTDFNFVAQKRAEEDFRRDGIPNPIWMPHAVEPMAYPYIPSIKKHDICFVGHLNSQNRIDALDRMFKEFPNFFFGQRLFEEAAEVYCQSKIVFNISISDDINMRVFEALSTRSFLLTNSVPTLELLFKDGVHLATYKTLDEAVEKAKYYLANDIGREMIAKQGQEEVLSKHTFRHRVETVLKHTGLYSRLLEAEKKDVPVVAQGVV